MKVKCEVIDDLLPLYIDEVCSNESKSIVEEHLKECNFCRDKFSAQSNEIIIDKNIIKENLKSKKPFKKIKNSETIKMLIMLLCILASIIYFKNNLIWHSNAIEFMEKFPSRSMTTIENIEYPYKGKKYRIILSASKENKDKLYLQCFQEKYGGLFYEPTYGASPGDSSSLYDMTMYYISGTNDHFIIVYGYNKDFKANSYSVENATNNQWITEDISKKEYFFKIYTNIVYGKIRFTDIKGNDISSIFSGQVSFQ